MQVDDVELFHLLFLDQLGRKIDKSLYALKGGCNLRFFLRSIRYSQDIDLDIRIVRKDTLRKTVNQILASTPFVAILRSRGLEIASISEPKQTETTQRWKIALKRASTSLPSNTKIEFSRRGLGDQTEFDVVDPLIIQRYQLRPIFATHYTAEAAYSQKISALVFRSETQARDLFDLFHLLSMGVKTSLPLELQERIEEGKSHALGINFDTFRSQVLAFLSPEDQSLYDDPKVWEDMVLKVVEELEQCS